MGLLGLAPIFPTSPVGFRTTGLKGVGDLNMERPYTMSFGASLEHTPTNPERTARATAANGWDVVYRVWTNRKAMARSIRMQERREYRRGDWKAVVALETTEGY